MSATTSDKTHRIVQLTAENVKRLHAVNITPDGNLVVIGGRNGQGKSSVLDSIAMAIGGADAALVKPIRAGEQKAAIVLNLGDLVIKRTFTEKGSSLIVENADGARYPSPQAILNELTNKLAFDPLAFTRLKVGEQKVALERLLNLDFTAHDVERAKVFAERTGVNRQVDELRAVVKGMPKHEGVPAEEESTAAIVAELDQAQKTALDIKDLSAAVTTASKDATQAAEKATGIRNEIKSLETQLAAAKEKLVAAEADSGAKAAALKTAQTNLTNKPTVDDAPIKQRLADLDAVNAKVRANKNRDAKIKEGQTAATKAAELTAKIEKLDKDKAEKIKGIKFPVTGLAVADTGVTFNDIPFSQASQADQIRVSVAIAAASNPKLRVMLIRDGSLLDQDSLKLMGELAAEHNLQVWIERVGKDQNVSVVIEDGQIEQPAAEPATTASA